MAEWMSDQRKLPKFTKAEPNSLYRYYYNECFMNSQNV